MSEQWEDVEVPRGTFIGWGEIGQAITFEVVTYSDSDGSDFNNQPCPEVVGILTADAVNYRDKGTRKETLDKGEFITLTCGQANLSKAIRQAGLEPGHLVRVTFEDTYKTAKGDGKAFKVQVNRAHAAAPKVDAEDLY